MLPSLHVKATKNPAAISTFAQDEAPISPAVSSTKLLTGSADNMCKLWEVRTGDCLHTWKHTVSNADVSVICSNLYVGSSAALKRRTDAYLSCCSCSHGAQRHTAVNGTPPFQQAPVRDVGFALGDKMFLSVLDNIMGNVPTVFVWDLELVQPS